MPRAPSIHRFKITLKDIKPPIWRRIEVPSIATFWDLHVAVQDAMGWCDCHLHEFRVRGATSDELRVGAPRDGWGMDEPIIEGWKRKISPVFRRAGDAALYSYDFGDGWKHTVKLEAIEPAQADVTYPRCLDGRRRCPPEDCGGRWGYEHLLAVLADPKHEEHADLSEWVGGPVDPEEFDASEVVFDDPKERLEFAME